MSESTHSKDSTNFVEQDNSSTTTTTSSSPEQTVVCVISEETGIQYLSFTEAQNIIEKQYRQILSFTNKMGELEKQSNLINDYFSKSTEVNKQLLERYRKLLDWIFKGGVALLFLSLILVALPLFLFIYKFNVNDSLDNLKSVLWWIVSLYGIINFGGLITWGLATFGFKKQLDSLEKKLERVEDKL